jgi:hypothetical protein
MTGRTALVACMSPLREDPRVRREIDWLLSDGWVVDTLGIGPTPDDRVRKHDATGPAPRWTAPRIVKGLLHTLVPYGARYAILLESQLPRVLRERAGSYDLIVLNDVDLVPWVVRAGTRLLAPGGRIHLDLHEWYPAEPGPPRDLTDRLTRGYLAWITDQLASPVFSSRSVVGAGLAGLYAERYGIEPPTVVQNAPEFEPLEPTPVDGDAIDLAYHGNADASRGLGLLTDALDLLEPRFRLQLMLTGPQEERNAMRAGLERHGDRVSYHEPVRVADIAKTINAWDLELIFFPPTRRNLEFALPNKFFEAIQGRLGVISGESIEMASIIRETGCGAVVAGWTAADLAGGLNALGVDDIRAMKGATSAVAHRYTADAMRVAFLRAVGAEG